jgi:serine/threonine protein kinase
MTVGYGTLEWMAPELMSGDGHYGEGVDVYAFGMMLYALLTLNDPHKAMAAVMSKHPQTSSIGSTSTSTILGMNEHIFGPASFMHALCIQGLRPELGYGTGLPAPLVKLIQSAWHQDPKHRPSFKQVILVLQSYKGGNTEQERVASSAVAWAINPICEGGQSRSSASVDQSAVV